MPKNTDIFHSRNNKVLFIETYLALPLRLVSTCLNKSQ